MINSNRPAPLVQCLELVSPLGRPETWVKQLELIVRDTGLVCVEFEQARQLMEFGFKPLGGRSDEGPNE
ncbi:MAG: hypothetical protein H8E66_22415 [Planctomycetes bacterium]|nr:hypothetical protein [Planctomycetota bacterium]